MNPIQYMSVQGRANARKVESYIKKEAASYRKQAEKIKANGVNLDKLEKLSRQHENNCKEYTTKMGITLGEGFQVHMYMANTARTAMQKVDDDLFGCFVNGKCVGFNYLG